MSRQKSITALLSKCRESFNTLKEDYSSSLNDKVVSEELKIDIKNIFENLRSCLDYLARDIYEKCVSATPPSKLYFPIRRTQNGFNLSISNDFPGVENSYPDVYNTLESIQPYNNDWLGEFNQLNNDNKHQDLVEQSRTERKQVTVSSKEGRGSVSWTSGVTFRGHVEVMDVPIDPRTQMPVPNDTVDTKIEIWVEFKFRENGESVLPFIQKSIDSVEKIFNDIGNHIYDI